MIRNTQKLLSKVVVYLALVLPAIIVKAFLTFFLLLSPRSLVSFFPESTNLYTMDFGKAFSSRMNDIHSGTHLA